LQPEADVLPILIGMLLCVVVPLAAALLILFAPTRPAPPVSKEELQRLAKRIQAVDPQEPVEGERPNSPIDISNEGVKREHPTTAPDDTFAHESADLPRSQPASRKLSLKQGPGWLLLACLVQIAIFTLLWTWILSWLASWHAAELPTSAFVLFPPTVSLPRFIPNNMQRVIPYGLVLGGYTGMVVHLRVVGRLLSRRHYEDYHHWEKDQFSFQSEEARNKAMRNGFLMTLLFVIPLSATVPLTVNRYTRFTEEEIVDRSSFLPFTETAHSYAAVSDIIVSSHSVKDKALVENPTVVIRFSDGQSWKADSDTGLPAQGEDRDRFLEFLSARTGKPIRRVKLIEDAGR
jgi:hypothetical protein